MLKIGFFGRKFLKNQSSSEKIGDQNVRHITAISVDECPATNWYSFLRFIIFLAYLTITYRIKPFRLQSWMTLDLSSIPA